MRLLPASLILGLVLVLSLAAKGIAHRTADEVMPANNPGDLVSFLMKKGFTVSIADPNTAPVWVSGVQGDCRVRIADVWPQGWARSIVSAEGVGQQVRYAFAGGFYDEQPVMMTNYLEYRQRLLRYFGLSAPPPLVRAILISPHCPAGTISPDDAAVLS
jgi:hypothetical protein